MTVGFITRIPVIHGCGVTSKKAASTSWYRSGISSISRDKAEENSMRSSSIRRLRSMKNIKSNKKELSPEQREELLRALKARFEKNMDRHKGLEWAKVQAKLEAHTEKLWSLNEMERTGGEPDVVGHDKKTGEYIFMIVQRKVLRAAQVFVTTVKGWIQGKDINQKITLL